MKKTTFYTEASYALGIIVLAFGTALMEAADFGVSMVVAPAYLFYLKISEYLSWFTFGMAEYLLQAVLIVITAIVLRKFHISYLFSFITAVIYGLVLDGAMFTVGLIPTGGHIAFRIVFYIIGLVLCSLGVSMLFNTYFAPEAYELFVKKVAEKYGFKIYKVKTIYDCTSCIVSVILSFCFFGLWHFEGVKWGTVICALINGKIIGMFSSLLAKKFVFKDALRLRPFFEKE